MKVLELFAGSRSIGNVAEKYGCKVFSVDIINFKKINLVKDICNVNMNDIPFYPDMIWASPPCTYFSVASIGHHWNEDHTPKTKEAIKGMEILEATLNLVLSYKKSIYYIENPVGKMRRKIKGINRTTITYCSYGDNRMKPTDIWSNNIFDIFNINGWKPKSQCFAGNKKCHHEEAPRGSKTGTQGLKNNYERSKIPEQLCKDIIEATIYKLKK
ncbi:MAG: putative DNA (cytosine-5)-methyltransferase [Prokaryotic dsDNA virus sp.]|nr:MAG: putative DNA (cytosine-5)-methyltransferase [Prokaryotic dsDNA virus sp.]|tara:strand:+ start:2821 stop:3462 length:642 start_codon:yes stop_codon:yes gene_type:complete